MRLHHIAVGNAMVQMAAAEANLVVCGYGEKPRNTKAGGLLFDQNRQGMPKFPLELVELDRGSPPGSWRLIAHGTGSRQTLRLEVADPAEASLALQLVGFRLSEDDCLLCQGTPLIKLVQGKATPWHVALLFESRDDVARFATTEIPMDNPLATDFAHQVGLGNDRRRRRQKSGSISFTLAGVGYEILFGPNGLRDHGFSPERASDQSSLWFIGGKKQ